MTAYGAVGIADGVSRVSSTAFSGSRLCIDGMAGNVHDCQGARLLLDRLPKARVIWLVALAGMAMVVGYCWPPVDRSAEVGAMRFIRQTVEVRFLPDKLSEAYILDCGVRYPLKLTDKQANSKVKRENFPAVDYSKGA